MLFVILVKAIEIGLLRPVNVSGNGDTNTMFLKNPKRTKSLTIRSGDCVNHLICSGYSLLFSTQNPYSGKSFTYHLVDNREIESIELKF